jgi:hypothetical protein
LDLLPLIGREVRDDVAAVTALYLDEQHSVFARAFEIPSLRIALDRFDVVSTTDV